MLQLSQCLQTSTTNEKLKGERAASLYIAEVTFCSLTFSTCYHSRALHLNVAVVCHSQHVASEGNFQVSHACFFLLLTELALGRCPFILNKLNLAQGSFCLFLLMSSVSASNLHSTVIIKRSTGQTGIPARGSPVIQSGLLSPTRRQDRCVRGPSAAPETFPSSLGPEEARSTSLRLALLQACRLSPCSSRTESAFYRVLSTECFLQSAFLQSAFYRVLSTECFLQSAFYRVLSTECFLQSAFYRVHSTECILQSAFYRVHSTECILQSAFYRVHSTEPVA